MHGQYLMRLFAVKQKADGGTGQKIKGKQPQQAKNQILE